jgi:hypothetical protein
MILGRFFGELGEPEKRVVAKGGEDQIIIEPRSHVN